MWTTNCTIKLTTPLLLAQKILPPVKHLDNDLLQNYSTNITDPCTLTIITHTDTINTSTHLYTQRHKQIALTNT